MKVTCENCAVIFKYTPEAHYLLIVEDTDGKNAMRNPCRGFFQRVIHQFAETEP